MTARQTAADKAAEDKAAADAKAADAKAADTKDGNDAPETVETFDPNSNSIEEVPLGIAEPEQPLRPTARDAQGIDRVLPTPDRNWEPAPLEATEHDKKRAKEREEREEEIAEARRDGRVHPVSGAIVSKEEAKEAKKDEKS